MQRKLTSKQVKAAYMLAQGKSSSSVSSKLKMRRETLWRWRQLPRFIEEMERVMGETREDLKSRIANLVHDAINTMNEALTNDYCAPKRTQAALHMLKLLGIEQILAAKAAKELPEITIVEPVVVRQALLHVPVIEEHAQPDSEDKAAIERMF